MVHDTQCLSIFGRHNDAARVAVYAVDKRRGERIFRFRIILPVFVKIVLHARDERIKMIVLVRVHDEPRLFIEDHDVLVFIDDVELQRGFQKIVFLRRLREELVFQVHRQHVALLQSRGNLAALAVYLDVLFADSLIQHRLRQVRVCFCEEFIDALVGVVLSDGDLFQVVLPFRRSVKKKRGSETTMPMPSAMAMAILMVSTPLDIASTLLFMKM